MSYLWERGERETERKRDRERKRGRERERGKQRDEQMHGRASVYKNIVLMTVRRETSQWRLIETC